MLERILIFIGAIVFTYLGVQEALVYYNSPGNKPAFIELENISEKDPKVKWVKIGKHYVDWEKAVIKYKDDSTEENNEITASWYALQNKKNQTGFINIKKAVIVCSFDKYKNKKDLPVGTQKAKSITGVFAEHLRDFNGEVLKKLENNYPGLDSAEALLLYDGKEPRLFYAWFMIGAGALCTLLTLLVFYWKFFTDRNSDDTDVATCHK